MATPFTIPVSKPTVAIVVLLLVHVPPAAALLNVVDRPAHIDGLPVTGYTGATVMVLATAQPELNV